MANFTIDFFFGENKIKRPDQNVQFIVLIILYVQQVVTQPKMLNRTFLYNLVHVT